MAVGIEQSGQAGSAKRCPHRGAATGRPIVQTTSFFEPAGSSFAPLPRRRHMKRTISLWLGLLAFAMVPVLAQTPAAPAATTGKIHGHVTNPTGAPQGSGSVSLSNDGGHTNKFTFPVNASGDYAGEAAPGTYTVIFRQADTPPDKMVDSIENVKVV